MEAIPPFPNSVNAQESIVPDKVKEMYSIKQKTYAVKGAVQAITYLEQFYYEYRNGQLMVTILKVFNQDKYSVDLRAWLWF